MIKIPQDNQEQNDTHHISCQEQKGNYAQTHFPINSHNSHILAEYETHKNSKFHTKALLRELCCIFLKISLIDIV